MDKTPTYTPEQVYKVAISMALTSSIRREDAEDIAADVRLQYLMHPSISTDTKRIIFIFVRHRVINGINSFRRYHARNKFLERMPTDSIRYDNNLIDEIFNIQKVEEAKEAIFKHWGADSQEVLVQLTDSYTKARELKGGDAIIKTIRRVWPKEETEVFRAL